MFIPWQKKEQIVEPYSKLAYIYDEIMSHVNYETWARYISRIINKWHSSATNIIDISCGTATLLLKLSQTDFNFRLFGFDYSLDMIAQAKKKAISSGIPLTLWKGDIKNFALKNSVDVIICLYDSINYILTHKECDYVFGCGYDGLQQDGLFIFDICTERNSIKYFDNYYENNKGEHYKYSRKSNYDRLTRLHTNLFKINFKNSDIIFVEIHKQKIYYIEELIQVINKSNFKIIATLDGFTFKPASENSDRVHFILKKV